MAARSRGKIHDVFVKNLTRRAAQSAEAAAAARSGGPRPWMGPDGIGDTLDVPGITQGFDRAEVNANFEELIAAAASPGTVGDAISLKVQCDVVGVLERGFRARHCTPVRLIGMMAARRLGHADARGVLGGILRYAQDALKAGQSAPNTTTISRNLA